MYQNLSLNLYLINTLYIAINNTFVVDIPLRICIYAVYIIYICYIYYNYN